MGSGVGAAVHRLTELLLHAVADRFPPDDGGIEVVGVCPPGSAEWVVSFTGHVLIATALPEDAVRRQRPDAFGGALTPGFLRWLAGPEGDVGCQDLVLVRTGAGGGRLPRRDDVIDHPRVQHARSLRPDVVVHGDVRGLVTLGHGLGGLLEIGIEVAPAGRGDGVGRGLLHDAIALVQPGEPVLAQVTPGNARSLRAFLAAGFRPIGSAVAIVPDRHG
jgi:GNAT superfamily N-acetyltransferase